MAKQLFVSSDDIMDRVMDVVGDIDDARKLKGMTVTQMCRKAGVTVYTYYHWLKGLISPSLASLLMVLQQLDMHIEIRNNDNWRTVFNG